MMGLLNDKKRKDSQVDPPNIGKLLPQIPKDAKKLNSVAEVEALPAPTQPPQIEETTPQEEATPQEVTPPPPLQPVPEYSPVIPQITAPQLDTPEVGRTVEFTAIDELDAQLKQEGRENLDPLALIQTASPEPLPAYEPSPSLSIPVAPKEIWSIPQVDGTIEQPDIIRTQLPTVYDAQNAKVNQFPDSWSHIQKAFETNNRREAEAAYERQKLNQQPGRNRNVPDKQKSWVDSALGWAKDILLGDEDALKRTARQTGGNFDPLRGDWGTGAGFGGILKYVVDSPGRFLTGTGVEVIKAKRNILKLFGMSEEDARKYAYDDLLAFADKIPVPFSEKKYAVTKVDPKTGKETFAEETIGKTFSLRPSDYIKFDWEKAQKVNGFLEAVIGNENIKDVNNRCSPQNSSSGAIFCDPGRKDGETWNKRPVQAVTQILIELGAFNPIESTLDNATSGAVARLFRRAKPVVKPLGEAVQATPAATEAIKIPVPQPNVGQILRESDVTPAPPATFEELQKLQQGTKLTSDGARFSEVIPPSSLSNQIAPTQPLLPPDTTPRTFEELQRLQQLQRGAKQSEAERFRQIIPVESLPNVTVKPSVPEASKPTTVPFVSPSGEVSRLVVPPTVSPEDLPDAVITTAPGSKLPPSNTPANTVLEIGIGKPGKQIEVIPEVSIRTHKEIVEAVKETMPKVLDDYAGNTTEELKQHLVNKLDTEGIELVNNVGSEINSSADRAIDLADDIRGTQELLKDVEARTVELQKQLDTTIEAAEADLKERLRQIGEANPNINLEYLAEVRRSQIESETEGLRKLLQDNQAQSEQLRVLLSTKQEEYKAFRNNQVTSPEAPLKQPEEPVSEFDLALRRLREQYPDMVDTFNGTTMDELREFVNVRVLFQPEANNITPAKATGIQKIFDDSAEETKAALEAYNATKATQQVESPKFTVGETQTENIFKLTGDNKDGFDIQWIDDVPYPVKKAQQQQKKLTEADLSDLLNTADELVLQKQIVEAALKQLDDYFETSVDFGRRSLQRLPDPVTLSPREVSPSRFFKVTPTTAVTKIDTPIYHGTAYANWTPKYNLSAYGSRGELGLGLYATTNKVDAVQYAKATATNNVNPETLNMKLSPSVNELSSTLSYTLDARATLKATDELWKQLTSGLDDVSPGYLKELKKSLGRKKNLDFMGFMDKVETSMVKGGVTPTEENLRRIQQVISNNLTRLGYDSVIDKQTGFVNILDESSVSLKATEPVRVRNPMEHYVARYNVDAIAAKTSKYRLTSDANLRESTYTLYKKFNQDLDSALSRTQAEAMRRDNQTLVAMERLLEIKTPDPKKPESFQQVVDDVNSVLDDICNL
jgi:hypothetical protein